MVCSSFHPVGGVNNSCGQLQYYGIFKMLIKAYYFQMRATTSRSQHHCTRAAKQGPRWRLQHKKERPVSSSSLSLLWEHILRLYFLTLPDCKKTDFRTTSDSFSGSRQGGTLTYWEPQPQTLVNDQQISHMDQKRHSCSQKQRNTACHAVVTVLGTAACFTSVCIVFLTHGLMFDITTVRKTLRCTSLQVNMRKKNSLSASYKDTGRKGRVQQQKPLSDHIWPLTWAVMSHGGGTFRDMTDPHIPFSDRNIGVVRGRAKILIPPEGQRRCDKSRTSEHVKELPHRCCGRWLGSDQEGFPQQICL